MSANGRLALSELAAYPHYRPLPGEPVGPLAGNLSARAARSLLAASTHCEATIGIPVTMSEGYRSKVDQDERWETFKRVGRPLAAFPGTSKHGWGLSADIRQDNALSWLSRNGIRFGWKHTGSMFSQPEPWHFDYVGGGDLENSPIVIPKSSEKIPTSRELEDMPRIVKEADKGAKDIQLVGSNGKSTVINDMKHVALLERFIKNPSETMYREEINTVKGYLLRIA